MKGKHLIFLRGFSARFAADIQRRLMTSLNGHTKEPLFYSIQKVHLKGRS